MSVHPIVTQLVAHRIQAGLTQVAVSEQAGMHPNSLGQIERGERGVTAAMASRIAAVLGLELQLAAVEAET